MTDGRTESSLVKASEAATALALTPETVTRYICALANPQEITLFLNQCVMFGLNPFKREIYLIKYKSTEPATFVVGYEVYLKRAERTGKWAGMESGTVDGPEGLPISAWVKVFRKDWERPLLHEVFYSEYVQMKDEWIANQKTGKKVPTRFWAEKPRTMLKKVAIAQAFRMAFPDEMAGMPYTAEEMPVEHERLSTAEIKAEVERVNYEAQKLTPLKDIKDEFTGGVPDEGQLQKVISPEPDETKTEREEAEGPTMAQLEKFAKRKTALAAFGINEETLWTGIKRQTKASFGFEALETGDLRPAQMELILGYLNRWEKALTEEDEARKKAEKANAKR